MQNWIDLSADGAALYITKLPKPANKTVLVLTGEGVTADKAKALGFRMFPESGVYYNPALTFTPNEFRPYFPGMKSMTPKSKDDLIRTPADLKITEGDLASLAAAAAPANPDNAQAQDAAPPVPGAIAWPDLEPFGMRLTITKRPEPFNDTLLAVSGGEAADERLIRLGFRYIEANKLWINSNLKLDLRKFENEFNTADKKIVRKMVAPKDIIQTARMRSGDDASPAVMLAQMERLGLNHLGQEVFLSPIDGRFLRGKDGSIVFEQKMGVPSPALFLRAPDADALSLCADGLIYEATDGRHLDEDDIDRFVRAVHGPAAVDDRARRAEALLAVRMAAARRMALGGNAPDRAAFSEALAFHDALNFNDTDSLPAPIAVIAQRLAYSASDALIAVVPDQTSNILTALPKSSLVRIVSQNADTMASSQSVLRMRGIGADTGSQRPKVTLTAIDHVGLARASVEMGFSTTRSDYLAALRGLQAREAEGFSVVLLGDDGPDTQGFLDHVSRFYEIEDAAVIDSGLYRDVPGTNGGRMLVIGRKRDVPMQQPQMVAAESVVDYDQLWNWSNTVMGKLRKFAPVNADDAENGGEVALDQDRQKRLKENSHQTVYVSASRVAQPITMVPRNLDGATRVALARIARRVGQQNLTIDQWVANEMRWTVQDMKDMSLAPEQIDAFALALDSWQRGRGFLIADETGVGKGVVVAMCARWCALRDIPFVFMTEKANLFQDIWRDIMMIRSEDLFLRAPGTNGPDDAGIAPFLLNAGASVKNRETNEVIFQNPGKEATEAIVKSNQLPPNCKLVGLTYSQVNRKLAQCPKAQWLSSIARGATIALDEAHNATGQSHQGNNIRAALKNCAHKFFSSATWAQKANNLVLFESLFPASINMKDLPQIAKSEAVKEAMSAALAEEGVMVRREHDLSRITFITDVPTDQRAARNRAMADKIAPIYSAMALMSGDVDRVVARMRNDLARLLEQAAQQGGDQGNNGPIRRRRQVGGIQIGRMGVSDTNFGSRLSNLNLIFLTVMKIDNAVDAALEALKNNRKPVIFIEQTMESLFREAKKEAERLGIPPQINFRTLLRVTLERMIQTDAVQAPANAIQGGDNQMIVGMPVRPGEEAVAPAPAAPVIALDSDEEIMASSARIADPRIRNAYIATRTLIREFPEMPVSPIDAIRERVEEAGFTIGEISGRSERLVNGNIEKIVKQPRNDIVDAFNDGDLDALFLTEAGSTGLSIHSSRMFKDQRQRELIMAQQPKNVRKRQQTYGRVGRRGEVTPPIIRTLLSGLPAEMRLEAMNNMKLREMAANVISNREHAALSDHYPDLLNGPGNEVCKRYLKDNPAVMRRMAISEAANEEEEEKRDDGMWWANQLTSKIMLLSSAEQEQVYQEVLSENKAVSDELEAKGQHPNKTRVLPGKFRLMNRQVFEAGHAADADSVLQGVVYLSEYQGERDTKPVRQDRIMEMLDRGFQDMVDDNPADAADRLERNRQRLLELSMPAGFATVDEAVEALTDNPVKQLNRRVTVMQDILRQLQPGVEVQFNSDLDEPLNGIVTRIKMPPRGMEHALGQWVFDVVVPGDEHPRRPTLYAFYKDPSFAVYPGLHGDNGEELLGRFDAAPGGLVEFRRFLLDGNVFRAAQMAIQRKIGSTAIIVDEWGSRRRGVVLTGRAVNLETIPVPMSGEEMARAYLAERRRALIGNPELDMGKQDSVYIRIVDGKCAFRIPPKTQAWEHFHENPRVIQLLEEYGGKRKRVLHMPIAETERAISIAMETGITLYVSGIERGWLNDWLERRAEHGENYVAPALVAPEELAEGEEADIAGDDMDEAEEVELDLNDPEAKDPAALAAAPDDETGGVRFD